MCVSVYYFCRNRLDGHGNIGMLLTPAIGGGTPSAGGNIVLNITTANEITDLSKWGFQTGVSAQGLPVPIIPGIGVEFCISDNFKGVNISFNFEVKHWAEGHGELGYTFIIPLYGEEANRRREWILETYSSLINKLSQGVKSEISEFLGLDQDNMGSSSSIK